MGISDQRALAATLGATIASMGLLVPVLASCTTPPAGYASVWRSSVDGQLKVTKQTGVTLSAEVGWPAGMFGDGSDGAADLDGVNAVAWASRSGSVYTMTRDAWLTNLTVRNGITLLKPFILSCNGTLTVESGGIVSDDGNAASGATAGAAIGATRRPGSAGQSGAAGRSTTGNGNNVGVNQTNSFGGAGGVGGSSGLGETGGSAGGVNAPGAVAGSVRTIAYALTTQLVSGTTLVNAGGGSGGGGGGTDVGTGTATSGGGGGAAPVSILFARLIANSGVIRCNGGVGGNASFTGNGQAGGGGGGGGGALIVVSNSTNNGTVTANGGTGGTGANGGGSGVDGSAGIVVWLAP